MLTREEMLYYLTQQERLLEDAKRSYDLELEELKEDFKNRLYTNNDLSGLAVWYLKSALGTDKYERIYQLRLSKVEFIRRIILEEFTEKDLYSWLQSFKASKMEYVELIKVFKERQKGDLSNIAMSVDKIVDIGLAMRIMERGMRDRQLKLNLDIVKAQIEVIEDFLSDGYIS